MVARFSTPSSVAVVQILFSTRHLPVESPPRLPASQVLRAAKFGPSPKCDLELCRYDLYGVINHKGNLITGHYTAACRVPVGKGKEAWYDFNDEHVTKIASTQELTPNAYILFYVRRD